MAGRCGYQQFKMHTVKTFDELIAILGLKSGDVVTFMGSQHKRNYELEIDFIPENKIQFEAILSTASDENLIKMGFGLWSTHDDQVTDGKLNEIYLEPGEKHFLFPGEWYDAIPNGFEVIDIFGQREKFIHGTIDNDCRHGNLPYGFVR